MNVDFKGYGENIATFIADDTVKEGMLVKMNGNYAVTACLQEDQFAGVCVGVRDGYAAVQLSGYVEMPTTSSVGTGLKGLVSFDSQTVTPATEGKYYLVVFNDDGKIGFIL